MSALRRLSAAVALSISMLLLSSGLAAAETTSKAMSSDRSDRDRCDRYDHCKHDHDDHDHGKYDRDKYDDRGGSYYKRHSAKLIDLMLRVKLLEKQRKAWDHKAGRHDDKADWHWKKAKDYEGKDWDKSKYYKDKARDHEREARKCRWKATKYRRAAYYEKHRADDYLLFLKLRLAL